MKSPCLACSATRRAGAAALFCCLLIWGCAGSPRATTQPEWRAPASNEYLTASPEAPQPAQAEKGEVAPQAAEAAQTPGIAPVWRPLLARLAKDGLSGPRVEELVAGFGPSPTQSPMGRKMRELYRKKFLPAPARKPAERYYRGVVTEANARLCREYIAAHRQAFELGEKRYGVPPAVACALLFVETRLGRVLGDVPENALFTLASMAVSRQPQDISSWLDKLPGWQQHREWMDETMRKRSDWAYAETRALIRHMLEHNLGPERVPGSIYGAVGLCQFMPSNIPAYGADGNGDGRVDLFEVPDAVASLSNYLARHGWKPGLSPQRRAEVLMSYNHSRVYADTILALAGLIAAPGPGAS